ncbi:MAG: serine/threonine-protein kinase [Paludibaculum sp.]
MNSERWRLIEGIFAEAVECPAAERSNFLDQACGADIELRRELESLLACDAPEHQLIELPSAMPELEDDTELAGRRVGPYRLIRLIGHGGMGAVYLGVRDDDQYQKQVAIKLLKRGMDTEFLLGQFRQERQILANLEHPFIARLMDGGATEDGLPYFVMEYVDGIPITQYANDNGLSVLERLRLFRLVCEAIQYAHQNLVVHRDIKPGNILTTKEGVPKLLDFGIAKVMGRGVASGMTLTQHELRMLTPDYASPEQVKGMRISTASDIYSLGAVLYELLSGQRPHQFPSESMLEVERVVCEIDPEKPSVAAARDQQAPEGVRKQRKKQLAGDLDNIVLAAMRKEPQRRYASVADLSEDIRRHMEGLPILVQEDRWTYRAGKFMRRNKLALGAAAMVLVSLIGGIVTTTIQARRAERRFQEVRRLANSFLFDIHDQIETLPGSTLVRASIVRTVLEYLNNLAREAGDDPALQWDLAAAYQKIGDVQGYGVRPNLGQIPQAVDSHLKALAIAEQLAGQGYDPKVQRLLAMAHHRIGFFREGDQDRDTGGIDHFQQAQEILERLVTRSPGSPEDSPLLITVYGHLGDAELVRGRTVKAAEYWQKALDTAEQWSRLNPSTAAQGALGRAHQRMARGSQLVGGLRSAVDHARKSIAIQEALTLKQQATAAGQRDLLNSYERLAFVAADPDYLNLGDLPMAAAYTSKVLALASSLSSADPNNRMAASDLIIAKRSTCQFMPDTNLERVVSVCREVVEANSRNGRPPIEVQPSIAGRLGPALWKLGRRREALQTVEWSVQLLNEALAQWPWRADVRRRLVRTHLLLGWMQAQAHQDEDALAHYRAAVAAGEGMLPAQAQDLALRRDLADSYATLGRYYEHSDRKQALAWYRKDQEVWSRWPGQRESGGIQPSRMADAAANINRCTQP